MTDTGTDSSLVLWAAELEAAAAMARAFVGTAFLPESLRVRDTNGLIKMDETVAQTTAALMTGQELGLGPMASLRSIDVIPPGSGSPALRAAALRGILQHNGHDIWVVESTDSRAIVRACRAGTDMVMESTWTIDRARKMGPRGFGDPKSSWQRTPGAMLVARATAEVSRWIASDALLGLPYIAEEIDGTEDNGPEGTEAPAAAIAAAPPRSAPRGRAASSRKRSGAPLAALPSPPTPGDGGADQPPGADVQAERITGSQKVRLWTALRTLGYSAQDRETALAALSGWIGRELASTSDLTQTEADTVMDAIAREQQARDARAAAEDAQRSAELSQEQDGEPG